MQEAFAHCEALVRAADKDRFLAALFAPAERRGALCALYAFNIEITRVREVIHDPLAGEIRLQWWTDVLAGVAPGNASSNPVAAALLATVERHRLPGELLSGLIAARRFDLYNDPMRSLAELEAYARDTSSVLLELAARILLDAGPQAPAIRPLTLRAGLGLGLAGLLVAFPLHAARGQLYLPAEVLDRYGVDRRVIAAAPAAAELQLACAELVQCARGYLREAGDLLAETPAEMLPGLLPVALARPLLDRLEQSGFDPSVPIHIAQWRRQWLIWRAARRPSRIFGG